MAGVALGATGTTFASQVQHFYSLAIAGVRLGAVAGAALGATGATSAWQVQHFDYLALGGARLGAAGAREL